MKLSDYVIEFLTSKGVSNIFYLPGGGCMHLLDSLGRCEQIDKVLMLHEQGVAIATESYSMTNEELGVALVTTGPGGTNTITGVAAAFVDSTPCLFISGQVKTSDLKSKYNVRQLGSQEVDIVSIVSSVTKYAVMVLNKKDIRYHLEKALYLAKSGRKGPVWIDIPLDIQGSDINPDNLVGFIPEERQKCSNIDKWVKETIKLINSSKRPVIIAGNGIRLSKCQKEFYELLELLQIPVVPTWKAMDLIENDNPLFAGKNGTLGERTGNFTVQNADLLISLGSKLDFSITGFNRQEFARLAKKIVVDIDQAEIDKLGFEVNVPAVCDVSDFIRIFLDNKVELILPDISNWRDTINMWLKKYPVVQKAHYETKDCVTTYAFIDVLCDRLSSTDIIIPCSAGTTAEIFFQAFKVKIGQKIRSNHGFGAMGFDIPSSIGACIASGKKRTICVAGDGGMQLNIQELAVISGMKLPIKLFVINNSGYASIRNMQRNHFEGRYLGSTAQTGLTIPDVEAIAKAYKIDCIRISSTEELKEKIDVALNSPGPVICNVIVDKTCVVSPRTSSKIMSDGSMKSTPLEDMFPFLPREEFLRDMIIPVLE